MRYPSDIATYLETDRLTMRPFTPGDADLLCELVGDPVVMRYLTDGRPTPREVVETETLPRILDVYARFPGFGTFATSVTATDEFVGWFELVPWDGDVRNVELAYRLRRAAWGHGYATEGARALIRKAFTELGVDRVWAETRSANMPSRRVMERSGLSHVRTVRPGSGDTGDGAGHGEVEYELLRADWERGWERGPGGPG